MSFHPNNPSNIYRFDDEHNFLSNFYYSPFSVKFWFWSDEKRIRQESQTQEVPTLEHAYQAMKTLNMFEQHAIITAPTAAQAKKIGRKAEIRKDWDDVKLGIMEWLVKCKFKNNNFLKKKLIETGDFQIQEGNTWGDTYWGICIQSNWGENHLGKILMKVRQELNE